MNCTETPGIVLRKENVREKSKIGNLKRIGTKYKINDNIAGEKRRRRRRNNNANKGNGGYSSRASLKYTCISSSTHFSSRGRTIYWLSFIIQYIRRKNVENVIRYKVDIHIHILVYTSATLWRQSTKIT